MWNLNVFQSSLDYFDAIDISNIGVGYTYISDATTRWSQVKDFCNCAHKGFICTMTTRWPIETIYFILQNHANFTGNCVYVHRGKKTYL